MPIKRVVRKPPDPTWAKHAACIGSTVHFPVPYPKELRREQTAQAKAICATCTVTKQCLEYAITNNEDDGVWGQYLFPLGVRAVRRRKAATAS